MSTSIIKQEIQVVPKKTSICKLACAIVLAGFSFTAQADKITSIPSATVPGVQNGFGGLNFDNVKVILNGTGSTFDETTGAYSFSTDSDLTYVSDVYDDDVGTTLMGKALAKPFPVGEPAGIKIVNDDTDVKEPKPTNCIMSTSYLDDHFLDEANPQIVLCSGPFQSHKRYKLAMLPTTVVGGAGNEAPVDLVFNIEAETGSRDYQVFQKINNWTNKRLKGFTIQVGTGLGGNFVAASDPTAGAGVDNLSLSVPDTIWAANQLAIFSTGLFGPEDTKHGRPEGYFDPDTRAGFSIVEYPNASGETDTLTSGAILPSDYPNVPPAYGAAVNQFGDWLPNNMLPYGIFFDDDGNPDTDAELKAWYGATSATGTDFGWMTGVADGFAAVDANLITNTWSNDPLYSMGVIDDLVNVGLNYIVTVGNVSATATSFTIRITPVLADNPDVKPAYVDVVPSPSLIYANSDAIIQLDPSPQFVPGSLLTARVADADLNASDIAIDTTTVEVTTNDSSVSPVTLTLEELGADRGVFVGNLPVGFSNVAVDTIVTVTYIDAAGGNVPNESIEATSTAVNALSSGNVQFNPASYTIAEDGGNLIVTVERVDGDTGEISVEYGTVSGTAVGNEDYVPATGTITFADGDSASQTIAVTILDDSLVENDESFTIVLSNAQGGAAIAGTNPATVTITDSDVASGGSSGGGFCSYNPDGRFDPVLPGLVLAALVYLGWRLKRKRAN